MQRPWTKLLGVILIALLITGCGGKTSNESSQVQKQISVAGSTTVQPLAEKLAEAFMEKHPDVEITVQGGGSSVGIKSAAGGIADIGAASRELKESEKQKYSDLQVFVIAYDGIAIIVHPGVEVDGLTRKQLQGIFAGKITSWKEVGGADKPIIVVAREEGSGTRAAFEELVMGGKQITGQAILQPSNGAVKKTVASTPYSIGFLSFGYLDEEVKALAVDGVAPTKENAAQKRYPLVRPLNLLTKGTPSGLVKEWLDFILGPEGQKIVQSEGYIPVK